MCDPMNVSMQEQVKIWPDEDGNFFLCGTGPLHDSEQGWRIFVGVRKVSSIQGFHCNMVLLKSSIVFDGLIHFYLACFSCYRQAIIAERGIDGT